MSWEVRQGDCIEQMREMDEASVDAIVTDPPYSLGFMGRSWDSHGEHEDAGFGYYLAGLIDGEGCFRVGAGERRCEFTMKMRDDDRWILERARAFIRHGRIATEKRRDGSAPQAKLVLDTKDGCAALCALLMRYPLRAKKLRDFLTWAAAVDEWLTMPRGNRWHGPADRARLAELSEQLRSERGYSEIPWSGNAFQDWCRRWATEALRVLKPGGHLLAMGGTRTSHRLAAGIEDAGFEIRDSLIYLYGSGFPKSLDVGKAIDKAAGAEREDIGPKIGLNGRPTSELHGEFSDRTGGGIMGEPADGRNRPADRLTAPATPEAQRWQGWGTALKPGHEPIVVARKPLIGTVAANVLEHGTGALNIDGCRIEHQTVNGGNLAENPHLRESIKNTGSTFGADGELEQHQGGRWPANVVLDEQAAVELDAQSGELTSGKLEAHHVARPNPDRNAYGDLDTGRKITGGFGGDSGGASRFFYCAKASRAERNAGLGGFALMDPPGSKRSAPAEGRRSALGRPRANGHPTVKPISLMRWLCRLVTPPQGTILDPFVGSGTTGAAAVLEGFDFIGVEREAEYVEIAKARIEWWVQHQGREADEVLATSATSERERAEHEAAGQLGLLEDAA